MPRKSSVTARSPPRAKARARIAELRGAGAADHPRQESAAFGRVAEYRFSVDGAIRTLLVNDDLRRKLSGGVLEIVRVDDRFELLPRAAAEKVRERDAAMIVLDHGQSTGTEPSTATSEDDAYYAQFQVPDDLIW